MHTNTCITYKGCSSLQSGTVLKYKSVRGTVIDMMKVVSERPTDERKEREGKFCLAGSVPEVECDSNVGASSTCLQGFGGQQRSGWSRVWPVRKCTGSCQKLCDQQITWLQELLHQHHSWHEHDHQRYQEWQVRWGPGGVPLPSEDTPQIPEQAQIFTLLKIIVINLFLFV